MTFGVKATILQAHLSWATARLGDVGAALAPHLPPDDLEALVVRPLLAIDWIPFSSLIAVDRAIARAAGGDHATTWRLMGRNSAISNLAGAYKAFLVAAPHRFFRQGALLHRRFQDFGSCGWETTGTHGGRMAMSDYPEYSPAYCASALGYYEGVLAVLSLDGRAQVAEVECQCEGAAACLFELAW